MTLPGHCPQAVSTAVCNTVEPVDKSLTTADLP